MSAQAGGIDQCPGAHLAGHRVDEDRPGVLSARLVRSPPGHDLADQPRRPLGITVIQSQRRFEYDVSRGQRTRPEPQSEFAGCQRVLRTVEEVAFVDLAELAAIEGFDEDTAGEIQTRARDYLAAIEAEHDGKRRELGVLDELREIDGVTTAMLVAFGGNDVKNIEDLAGCATDDLVGWTERKDGVTTKYPGFLDGFEVSREEAEGLIMAARVRAGWIEAPVVEAEPEAGMPDEATA